jgi:hypothetical protein
MGRPTLVLQEAHLLFLQRLSPQIEREMWQILIQE